MVYIVYIVHPQIIIMVGDFIAKAWDAYKKNFWTILAAKILEFVIVGVVGLIFLAVAILMFVPGLMSALSSGTITTQVLVSLLLGSIPSIIIAVVGIIVVVILFIEFEAGLVGMYAESLKGRTEIGTMFSTMRKKFWSILGVNILVLLIALLLVAVLILPAVLFLALSPILGILVLMIAIIIVVLIMLFFNLVNQSVVVGNKSAGQALEQSFSVVKANYLSILALVIIFIVISMVVMLIGMVPFLYIPMLLVNLLAIAPLQMLSFTAFYNAKTRQSAVIRAPPAKAAPRRVARRRPARKR